MMATPEAKLSPLFQVNYPKEREGRKIFILKSTRLGKKWKKVNARW